MHGDVNEAVKVTTRSPWSIGFGYHVEWWSLRTVCTSHYTQAFHGGELLLAIANLVVSRHHVHAKTGGPTVGMKCSTQCLATAVEKAGVVFDGNSMEKMEFSLQGRLLWVFQFLYFQNLSLRHLAMGRFEAKSEVGRIRINTSKSEVMVLTRENHEWSVLSKFEWETTSTMKGTLF